MGRWAFLYPTRGFLAERKNKELLRGHGGVRLWGDKPLFFKISRHASFGGTQERKTSPRPWKGVRPWGDGPFYMLPGEFGRNVRTKNFSVAVEGLVYGALSPFFYYLDMRNWAGRRNEELPRAPWKGVRPWGDGPSYILPGVFLGGT